MTYRIVRAALDDYRVESKGLFFWNCLHSTPGFQTEQEARDFVRHFTNPTVIAEFDKRGTEVYPYTQLEGVGE